MLMMPIVVGVLVAMSRSLVAVLMAIMAMRARFVLVLMLMLVLVMTAHQSSLLSYLFYYILIICPSYCQVLPLGSVEKRT